MLDPVFDARHWTPGRYAETVQSKDYSDEQEARAAVEAAGEGQLIKFARTHNLPGALPRSGCTASGLRPTAGAPGRK